MVAGTEIPPADYFQDLVLNLEIPHASELL